MEQCIFCTIIDGGISAHVLHRDATTCAFLDVKPCAPGHTLVVPVRHAETIADLQREEVTAIFETVQQLVSRLMKAMSPHGFSIGINHGKASGQAVAHLHVHIIPRWNGDGGGSLHSIVQNPTRESLEAIAKKINDTKSQ